MRGVDGIDVDIDREEVASFLQKKGSIELLIVVSEDGAQYTEIDERTRIVESTLGIRLQQGVEVGVIADESRRVDGERKDVYVLTPLGLAIRERMYKSRMGELFWRLMELRQQFDESSEDVVQWVMDEDSDLEDWCARMTYYEDFDDSRGESRDYSWQ